jgi:hypothetical protein
MSSQLKDSLKTLNKVQEGTFMLESPSKWYNKSLQNNHNSQLESSLLAVNRRHIDSHSSGRGKPQNY